MSKQNLKKVCVVGTGIGGLTAGWLLSKNKNYDVTLYEGEKHLGMDAHSIELPNKDPKKPPVRLDMPLRVFTETYYPNLCNLYKAIKAKYTPQDYSGSFLVDKEPPMLKYKNWIHFGFSIPYIIPSWKLFASKSFLSLGYNWIKFIRESRKRVKLEAKGEKKHFYDKNGKLKEFGSYIEEDDRFPKKFIERVVYPVLSGICTCSYEGVSKYPALIVCQYLVRRNLRGVNRTDDGTKFVVEALSKDCTVKLSTYVTKLTWFKDKNNEKKIRIDDSNGGSIVYDYVILATQANQAAKILQNSQVLDDMNLKPNIDSLNDFPHETSNLITHTDYNLMPVKKSDWSPVCFIYPNDKVPVKKRQAMASIWLNKVQFVDSDVDYIQTWNPFLPVDPKKNVGENKYERPVVTVKSVEAQKILEKLQGKDGLFYCGSYVLWGVPLLENAVTSACHISQKLGAKIPWEVGAHIKHNDKPLFFSIAIIFIAIIVGLFYLF